MNGFIFFILLGAVKYVLQVWEHLLFGCNCVRVGIRIEMSSAYVISFILLFGGVGMFDVYILNSVAEGIPPCGTPIFIV